MRIYILHTGSEVLQIGLDKITKFNPVLINGKRNGVIKVIRALHYRLNFPFYYLWIHSLIAEIPRSSILIIFDSKLWEAFLPIFKKHRPDLKLVFWFWNKYRDQRQVNLVRKYADRIFSYDKENCKKFNFDYHPQFYWDTYKIKIPKTIEVLFIGYEKNRIEKIEKIYLQLKHQNIKTHFHVVRNRNRGNKSKIFETQNEPLSYYEIQKLIMKSKCILEITEDDQAGLTLRSLESIFYECKLITTNEKIAGHEFFNDSNILILKDGDTPNFQHFLSSKQKPYNDKLKNKYHINHWITQLTSEPI